MRVFSTKVAKILSDLEQLEVLAVKVASEHSSKEAQVTQTKAANQLYDVMQKEASRLSDEESWQKMVTLTEKMASCLGKPELTDDYRVKLASAVVLDDMFSTQLEAATGNEREKVASLILYGREYISELFREALV